MSNTIILSVPPADALRILAKLDKTSTALIPARVDQPAPLHWGVHVDGSPTVHVLKLNVDGTWTFTTEIVP